MQIVYVMSGSAAGGWLCWWWIERWRGTDREVFQRNRNGVHGRTYHAGVQEAGTCGSGTSGGDSGDRRVQIDVLEVLFVCRATSDKDNTLKKEEDTNQWSIILTISPIILKSSGIKYTVSELNYLLILLIAPTPSMTLLLQFMHRWWNSESAGSYSVIHQSCT